MSGINQSINNSKAPKKVNFWIRAAVYAAVYAALTFLIAPLSYGVMQIRFAEALVVFALFDPAAVYGLGAGCFIANLIGPNGIWDIVIGTLASIAGLIIIRALKKHPFAGMLFHVLINGTAIGLMLHFVYGIDIHPAIAILWITAGEALSCMGLGLPLLAILKKRRKDLGL